MARSEKPAAPQQQDAGVRERWTAERREQIAVYFLQVYATSHTSTLRTPKPRSWGTPRLKTKSPRPPNRDRGKYRIHFRRWHSTPTRHFTSQVPRLGFQQSS